MKLLFSYFLLSFLMNSCNSKQTDVKQSNNMVGTWKLVKATVDEKGKIQTTDFTGNVSFIKIINDTHFAFLQHDTKAPKDSNSAFAAGGGNYTLKDTTYTEHLEYCSAKVWEGKDFQFAITIKGDTLTQHGREKIEGTNIDRINTEVYCRLKK